MTLIILILLAVAVGFVVWAVMYRREREEMETRRDVVLDLIDRQDVSPIEKEDRAIILEHLIRDVIGGGAGNRAAEEIFGRVDALRGKAETTGVNTLDDQCTAVELMAENVLEGFNTLVDKVKRFLSQEGVRYSTVGVFAGRLEEEVENLNEAFPRLRRLVEEIDRGIDQVIHSQDQGLVSVEFGGTAAKSEDVLRTIGQNIESLKSDLGIMVDNIEDVYSDAFEPIRAVSEDKDSEP